MREDELRTISLFKALANPVRYKILKTLAIDEQSVTQLSLVLGRKVSIISQHLSVLRHNQLVRFHTRRNKVFYRIKKKEVLSLLQKANDIVKRKG